MQWVNASSVILLRSSLVYFIPERTYPVIPSANILDITIRQETAGVNRWIPINNFSRFWQTFRWIVNSGSSVELILITAVRILFFQVDLHSKFIFLNILSPLRADAFSLEIVYYERRLNLKISYFLLPLVNTTIFLHFISQIEILLFPDALFLE